MDKIYALRSMLCIFLFLTITQSCTKDEVYEDVSEEIAESFKTATIYYEKNYDKVAIIYTRRGEKKTFRNGIKVETVSEPAPNPVELDESVNPDYVEIIPEELDDAAAIDKTTSSGGDPTGQTQLNADVAYWKAKFDAEWMDSDGQIDSQNALDRAKSANKNQEYYFLAYYIDGLTSVWQATGDNSYLDTALSLINNTMDDAVSVGGGYLGWPAADGVQYALWDSFYWRTVATLIRVMYQSPNLRATGNYQAQYDRILAFSEKNIWDRYESQGSGNFYRVNTHMSSHWARIGMELYVITGKQKYKEVFDNISFGTMPNRPSNLRNQIYPNPNNPSCYSWDYSWGVTKGSSIQDTSHGAAIVSFWVNAYENGMYWDKNDIDALINTLNDAIWKDSDGTQFKKYINGVGEYDYAGRLHEWLTLGRYNQAIQDKIKKSYTGKNLDFFGVQPIGIAALNAKILTDGKPVYPEN